jgi:outer membrane protein OmpA-like peptidoglycan-associated protein
MIRFLFLLISLFFLGEVNAQFILPQFETPAKVESINTDSEESLPMPYLNGDKMYFVRTAVLGNMKQRSKGQEVWQTNRVNGSWEEATNQFDAVNDNGNNAVIGTSKDGKRVYVFNSVQTRRKLAKGITVTSNDENGNWSDLEKVEIPGFKISDGLYSFYMNTNEDVLLISMPAIGDTSGFEDLYISTKDAEGNWQPIVSLGDNINTPKSELSPYLADDNKTLYFSSTGHDGLGDADVFVAYREGDSWTNWSNPLNMGAPINSPNFDAYFIIGNNQEVYFTSNRGQLFSDIYYSKITKELRFVGGGEIVNGKFVYNGLPAEGVTLNIYDANDQLIEQVVTDVNGLFSYTKLNPSENYIIQLADKDADNYEGAKVYLLDDAGNPKKRLFYLGADKSFLEEEPEVDPELMISGIFEYKKLPKANTALVLLNENGEPIDTIYTDANGKFQYNKIDFDKASSIRPLNMTDKELADAIVFIDGEKRQKLTTLSPDKNSLSLIPIGEDKETIKGVFQFKKLPVANAGLVVWDESGFPVDTIYTDENGNFTYKKIKTDVIYSLRPLDLSAEEMDDAIIYLLDDNNQIIAKSDQNSFLMEPYTEGDEVIYTHQDEIADIKKTKELIETKNPIEKVKTATKKAEEKVEAPISTDHKGNYTLDYPFNHFYLGKDDKQTLLKVISIMKKDKSLTVKLIGHTDNVGRDEVNQEVSVQRAEVAKKYMTDRRISSDRITTEGMADKQPIATNDTKVGRAENRRVEVKF